MWVVAAKAFGNEDFDGLSGQLRGCVAEQLLCLRIDQDDAPTFDNNGYRVRNRVNKGREVGGNHLRECIHGPSDLPQLLGCAGEGLGTFES